MVGYLASFPAHITFKTPTELFYEKVNDAENSKSFFHLRKTAFSNFSSVFLNPNNFIQFEL